MRFLASVSIALPLLAAAALYGAPASARPAPEFVGIESWINSAPLSMRQLRGKVVLVDFWTFDCINCLHVLPYVKAWHQKYKDQGLVVVGVHTPEHGFERKLDNLQAAVQRKGISFPVAQDSRFATWDAYANQYWPAFYLVDKKGEIVYTHFGEGDYARTEAQIRKLLAQ
jgi:thiol-disulfide isomerase/thioredoxin